MTPRPITAFLSGTRTDFRPHPFFAEAKKAIEEGLGYQVRMMEDAEAEDIQSDHWSRREAASPDVLVGLIGNYYGHATKTTGRSLTEEEYLAAGDLGIDRLMFVTDAGDAGLIEAQNDAAKGKIQAFRQMIDEDVVRKGIKTPEEFAEHVVLALKHWETQTFRGALVKAKVHYANLLDPDRPYNLRDPIVGQSATLETLEKFLASEHRIFILEAPWGRGKSRVVLEIAERHPELIRFLREGAEPAREFLGLSPRDPRVIVVDDSHRRDPAHLRILLDLIRRCQPCVKVIFATRGGQLRANLDSAIQGSGFGATEIESMELPPLSDSEQRQLIERITGRSGPDIAVVARRTRGNTLAAVIAARLIRRGQLNVANIEDSPDFDHKILRGFETEALNAASLDPGIQRQLQQVLEAIALAGPVRPGDESQAKTLAEFVRQPREELLRAIGDLEKAGLLLRRGGLVRVAVDAIAESVVFRACITEHGEETGLAERALAELCPLFGRNVLRNLALAEWEGTRSGRSVSLLDQVWPMLLEEYKRIGGWVRLSFLEALEEVAPLQSRDALNFVQEALPLGMGEPGESLFGNMEQRHLNDAFTGILRGVLYDPGLLRDACDLLWTLAASDQRPPHQYPSSPERILREVAKFAHSKPLEHYEAFLSWAESKAHADEIPGERLCEYVSPLLEKEVEVRWADDGSFNISSSRLNRDVAAPLRRRATALLARIVREQGGKARHGALKALVKALNPPPGLAREVTRTEIDGWEPERLELLTLLAGLRTSLHDPLVSLTLRTELWRFAKFEKSEAVKSAVSQILAELDSDLAGTLELALTPAYHLGFDTAMQFERDQEANIDALVDQLSSTGKDPMEIFENISAADQRLTVCGLDSAAGRLLFALSRRMPAWGLSLLEEIASEGEGHPLAYASSAIVDGAVRETGNPVSKPWNVFLK